MTKKKVAARYHLPDKKSSCLPKFLTPNTKNKAKVRIMEREIASYPSDLQNLFPYGNTTPLISKASSKTTNPVRRKVFGNSTRNNKKNSATSKNSEGLNRQEKNC